MLKRFSILVLMLISVISLSSCKKTTDYSKIRAERPDQSIKTGDYDLNFVIMHNYVINYISQEFMPFFYIKNNSFDISGDNEKKIISVKCTCVSGTVVDDVDLFLSMVLNGIATNAAEQDYRFKAPSVSSDGTYIDFGNVFDVYALKIYADVEDNTVLRDDFYQPKAPIPINPKFIKE